MAAATLELRLFATAAGTVLALEAAAWCIAGQSRLPALVLLGVLRLFQSAAVVLLAVRLDQSGAAAVGLRSANIGQGFKNGLRWSLGFGALTAAAGIGLHLCGLRPLAMIDAPLPTAALELTCLFIVGGVVGPLAEEIVFRGLVFGFLRRWGFLPAALGSTLLFVLAHSSGRGLPLPQTIGGLLFAAAYEKEKNLLVPITLHVLGNLAIYILAAIV